MALLGLLPYLGAAYPIAIAAEGNALLGSLGGGRELRFESHAEGPADLTMEGYVAGEEQRRWRAGFSVRRRGFWPTVTVLALLIATPMPGRRRVWVLPLGAVLQNAALMLHTVAFAWVLFESEDPRTSRVVEAVQDTFESGIFRYAVVFGIWGLLANPLASLDLSPLRRLLGRSPPDA